MMRLRVLLLLPGLLLVACVPPGLARLLPPAATVAVTVTPAPPTPTPGPTPEGGVGPYSFPPGVNPLTGLPVDDPARLTLRPVAVKISNAPPLVRPQDGIGQADVVFEHYVEGGLTRFTAVFLSQLPRRVGSVRSARLIDVEIPEMFESYLVYAGSSGGVRERIEASQFAERAFYGVETGPPAYYRDEAIPIPHNLFADLVAVHELAARRGVNTPPAPGYSALAFSPAPPFPGEPATGIDLQYNASGVHWQYDPQDGLYYRWSDGQPHYDATLNRQVSAANVVVLYVHHVEDPTIVESESAGHQSFSIQIQFWGAGDALIFRDGQAYRARWERPVEHYYDMFVLRDERGEIMRLKPGVTFFQFVPLDFDALAWE